MKKVAAGSDMLRECGVVDKGPGNAVMRCEAAEVATNAWRS